MPATTATCASKDDQAAPIGDAEQAREAQLLMSTQADDMSGAARPRRLRSSAAAQPDAPACGAPAEASPRRRSAAALPRVPSEQLIKTAHLVRSESSKHLLQHLSMIASGEHPLVITFNLMVAISSLLYLIVSYTYLRYEWYRCAALFVMVTLCSLLADSVMPQSKLITSADRVFATAGTLVSPVRILLMPGLSCWATRLWVMFALTIALSSLVWSRHSPDMAAFAKRHTIWHILSVAGLTWLAHADARGVLHLPPFGF